MVKCPFCQTELKFGRVQVTLIVAKEHKCWLKIFRLYCCTSCKANIEQNIEQEVALP